MEQLYRKAWEQLARDRRKMAAIDPLATPVLAFGDWKNARVVTAGLNPSEREFRDEKDLELGERAQRFLHWPEGDALTEDLSREAFRRSEGYFTLGNHYQRWFQAYEPFLKKLGVSFASGSACHTDYLSPFTTRQGISEHEGSAAELMAFGLPLWAEILAAIPNVEVVVGHGRGHGEMKKLFGFSEWETVVLPFAVNLRSSAPPFLYRKVALRNGREVHLFWWWPNRGSPLSYLSNERKGILGDLVLERWRG